MEARNAMLLGRLRKGPASTGARDALEIATRGGAACLGRAGEIGELSLGACGDLAVWPLEGPAFAGATQEVTFEVGHGCTGADTKSVTLDIPSEITAVRAVNSNLGPASVTKDASSGLVTKVTWQKDVSQVLATDDNFYTVTVRIKVPNTPFVKLHFVAHQVCRAADGTETTVNWDGTDEEAPEVLVLPPRQAGWNKYTVPAAVSDLNAFFSDAAIVWKGTAAWSPNANTTAQISSTKGVTALTSLAANDEVLVKY